jgi:Protein of unknown function (DUF1553)/Protein of unknown function (DUF1549)/Concanavalin A-like lectin/glucanases superfamily/Planctomycete cytochrome C
MSKPLCHSFASSLFFLIASVSASAEVDFNNDIRPILSDVCFKCHGPDEAERQGELRFDTRDGLFGTGADASVVVQHHPEKSELYLRLISNDPDERMPPADSKLALKDQQIAAIRKWIEQGAKWEQHWAFVPPRRTAIPSVEPNSSVRNPIDSFVAARLKRERLRSSYEADRRTLIRRATLDLTGLPPTPSEVTAFVTDKSLNAYERLVDRLLQSPAYGERMAVVWLDAARYADTSGYQNDGPRDMWRWRDWVVDAYNAGMPFDQFTREQIAGDLLPDATLEQQIATGFHRNHRGNAEGGIIAEEFQVEYVVDRVETTGTVWLGLTIGCARCHEHKYDPFSQQEFYELFAYFNNIPENGRAVKEGNSPPYIKAPTAEQQRQLQTLDEKLSVAEKRFAASQVLLRELQSQWESRPVPQQSPVSWDIGRGLVASYDFYAKDDVNVDSFRDGEPAFAAGPRGVAAVFDGKRFIDAGDVADFGYFDRFSLSAWIRPESLNAGTIMSRMTDTEQADGYYVQVLDGHIHVNFVKRWLDDCIRVETRASVKPHEWTHVLVTYDGSRIASGISVYLNGEKVPLKVNYDFINQSFAAKQPFRIGAGGGNENRFRGLIDEVRIYDLCLDAEEAEISSVAESITDLISRERSTRTAKQQKKLASYFLAQVAPAIIRQQHEDLLAAREERRQFMHDLPTVMIMQEGPRRATHVLTRGEYDKPGHQVSPRIPAILDTKSDSSRDNRLDLANWLIDAKNPLTARVAVNRYWQMYFGYGLVKTAEDFGTQGERPSHPALLDWLANEFVLSGWDVKALQRTIVTSATYRQSSRVTNELLSRDPENRLLARGPRFRLPAETVRDQALAAAGLLTARVGGPSVLPYQPGDLWKDIASDSNYDQDHGADLYRRSMYTYWKRTVVPPAMSAFDGAAREMCQVRPRRTNTPLQALTLMNDVTFVEAARVIAQYAIASSPEIDQRLATIFRTILARDTSDQELAILRRGLQNHLTRFEASPTAAQQLIEVGEYTAPPSIAPRELAAYTTIASLILNLDEAVTKQ